MNNIAIYKQNYPWNFKNFTKEEVQCKCGCGQLPTQEMMITLQELRFYHEGSIVVSSAARCKEYDLSVGGKGEHALGEAVDILCILEETFKILDLVFSYNANLKVRNNPLMRKHFNILPHRPITRIGINQKGDLDSRFLHLGIYSKDQTFPNPCIWSY